MYIYFDTNGTIKEIVNDKSIRQGSTEANKIYCYIEGNPTIDDIWYMQKLPSGETSNEVSFKNSTVTKAIPYDAKRDMKYFKDFEQYTFYVFTLNAFLVSQKGLNLATIRIVVDNEIFALGELTFNVQENVINVDNGITISQYDYLLLAYASRTLNEVTANDLDALLDDKINAKIGDLANGSPKVFDTEYNIEAMHDDEGIAVATDTGYIYVWNDTQEQYISTGMKYIADVSLFYTKTQADNTFAPKSTAITHTGNQLQDYSGNNIYPVIDSSVVYHSGNQLKDNSNTNFYPNIDETKINLLDVEIDGIFVISKNILDMDNITRTEGKYLNISNGNESTNASYFYTNEYIPVEPNTTYYVNSWKKSDDTQLSMVILGCLYDEHKTYISGFNSTEFTTPSNCYFLRFSTVIDAYNYRHISISKTVLTRFVPYYKIIKNSLTEERIIIKCASSGIADFRNLRKCLESITDASKDRQYVVELAEGTYDFTNDITSDELSDSTFKGIFVPDFVTIKGIGNAENTIIQLTLTEQNNNISTLNMRNTAGLENLTVKGTNTRYVIHDDFTDNSAEVYYRTLKNVRIIGTTCSLSTCYGCGAHSGMIAKFENCVFDGTNVLTLGGNGIPVLIHNNVEWTHSVHFTFENCRMLTVGNLPDNVGSSRGGLLLRTLQHAYNNTSRTANMFVYVTIKGCELNDIVFKEENSTYYGTGCMFKVNGYGNKNDDYRIYVTDSVDYSSYVDLI